MSQRTFSHKSLVITLGNLLILAMAYRLFGFNLNPGRSMNPYRNCVEAITYSSISTKT